MLGGATLPAPTPAGLAPRQLDPAKLDAVVGGAVQPPGSPLGGSQSSWGREGVGTGLTAPHRIPYWLGNSRGSVEGS